MSLLSGLSCDITPLRCGEPGIAGEGGVNGVGRVASPRFVPLFDQTGRHHDGTLDQLALYPADLIQVGGSFIPVGVDAPGELPSAADAEFLVDVPEVGFHCFDGEVELVGDFPVGSAGLGELGDGGFWWAELVGFPGAGASTSSSPFGAGAGGMPTGSGCLSEVKRLGEQDPCLGGLTAPG